MINDEMQDALNQQINMEFNSAYSYLSLAAYFEVIHLKGFAHWMRIHYLEERMHANKIFDFIVDRDGRVELLALDKPRLEWSSPLEAFEWGPRGRSEQQRGDLQAGGAGHGEARPRHPHLHAVVHQRAGGGGGHRQRHGGQAAPGRRQQRGPSSSWTRSWGRDLCPKRRTCRAMQTRVEGTTSLIKAIPAGVHPPTAPGPLRGVPA